MAYDINSLRKTNRKTLGNEVDIAMFRLVRFMDLKKYLGTGANAVIYAAGKQYGKELNPKSVEEVVKFCMDLKIGIISIINKNPLTIRVNECITCSGLEKNNELLCYFEGGFIAGCLESIYGKKVNVKETKCEGLGDDFCQFEVSFCN